MKKILPVILIALAVLALVILLVNYLPAAESEPDDVSSLSLVNVVPVHSDDTPPTADAPTDPPEQEDRASSGGMLTVHFLNVEQGDCIFLELPDGKTTLIDCGERDYSASVISQIYALGYTRIDYLFATHPHSDHIGGMRDIIPNFEIGALYLPDVSTNTASYEKMLEAAVEYQVPTILTSAGKTITPCEGVEYQILAPIGSEHDGLNNWSIVLRVVYGDTAFLFCGDAELESVGQILASGVDLSADVLKLGHHGSSDALTEEFFAAISPSYAVACCAEVNDYGHPHREVVKLLADNDVPLLLTYEGNQVLASDGSQVYYVALEEVPTFTEAAYIGNRNSRKFHLPSCDGLPGEKNRVYFEDRQTAIDAGYEPCPVCNP